MSRGSVTWNIVRTFAAPSVALVWRAFVLAPEDLARDWIAILSSYFILRALPAGASQRGLLTVITVTLLLGIYVYGQFPYTLWLLGKDR